MPPSSVARLDAGEMPPLHAFVFTTDYSPATVATLLQSAALNCSTSNAHGVAPDESVIRWGLSEHAGYQKLSDELIMPNLDQDILSLRSGHKKKLRKPF